jgi:gas vesicle protein
MNKRSKNIAIGTMIAGAMGYLAGILTAPKSGSETRRTLQKARTSGMAEAEKNLKRLHTELNKLLGEVADTADDLKNPKTRGKKISAIEEDVIDKAGRTRQKTREILTALHDGNADDKDLDKAVSEASKAIKSIRSYLKK